MNLRLAVCLLLVGFSPVLRAAERPIDYLRDIRPLLADNCFNCHGPDEASRKGKYRLDLRESALKGGRSGLAGIVPNNPEGSEIIRRLTTDDASEVMPPPKTGKKLNAAQIDLLKRWIAQGANYKTHWGFTPPVQPTLPVVRNTTWVRNPIDQFILARLEREGLNPSPIASRATLLRRLTLDLTGLPPTPEQIEAFLNDSSPLATIRVIDRLLASPAYGEKWARHWLDAARYADSDGYEKDKPRSVWPYRDWVIQALNADMGYDRFLTEQLAGDLLPGAGQDEQVATGFLRNSMINEEGGIDPEQFRMEALFDRMDAIGKSMLGLTLSCAQCHNHKYDPITQEDYYRLFAFLNDTHEASIVTYTPAQQRQRADLFRQIREIEADLRHRTPDWSSRLAAWERQMANTSSNWKIVPVRNAGDNAQRYIYHDDGSQTAWGYAPTKWTSQFAGVAPLRKITGFRLELLTDPNLPLGGPGRSPIGLMALSEFHVDVTDPTKPGTSKRLRLVKASADFANPSRPLEARYDDRSGKKRLTGPVEYAIDGNHDTAWGIDAGPGRRNVDRQAVFVPDQPVEVPEGAVLTFSLVQMHGGWNSDDNQNNNLGRFRFAVTDAPSPQADPLPRRIRDILAIDPARRTPAQTEALFRAWMPSVPEWKEANDRIEKLWQQHPEGTPQLTTMAREKQRPTFLLQRGDFLKPTKLAQPGVPTALHAMPPGSRPDRLGLARWLVDRNSPTTARALVNRVWQTYFGTGLVATSEDLGTQAEPPSHPELLDWLAVEFMQSGWSLKHLHRLIASSATYQQSSRVSEEHLRRDPDNRLLARGPRFRVEAETVRDIALAAAGLLYPQIGGPPVYPPAPAFLFQPPASYGPKVWLEETGPQRYRRALYTFRFRSVPYPVLSSFDAPTGEASCVRRPRSNTPLQALATLNETLFLEAARGLARVVLAESGDERQRLQRAFLRCTGRKPTSDELKVLSEFLHRQTQRFAAADARPWELAADNPAQPPALPHGVTPAQAAAWTALARLLLNLDETITKE